MGSQSCRVVLTGELVDGYSREAVIAAVARLFETSAGRLIELFDGRPFAVDEELESQAAAALQRQLEAVGACAHVETLPGDAPVFPGLRRPHRHAGNDPAMMRCPACGHRQLVSDHCDECGVRFADHVNGGVTPAWPAPPPSRPAVPPSRPPAPSRDAPRPPPPARDIHARNVNSWANAWVDEGNEMPSEEFHLSLYMGLNGERLLRACKKMKVGPRTLPALSWNGAAVFSPFLWTMYRKMWMWSLVVFVADILLPVLFIALGTQQYISDKFTYLGVAGLVANRVFWPFVVDYLYCRHARRMVQTLNRMSPTFASDIDIATAGGTSKTSVFVGVVVAAAVSLLTWNIVESVYAGVMRANSDFSAANIASRSALDAGGASEPELTDDAKRIMTRSAMRSIARRVAIWLDSKPPDINPEGLSIGMIARALGLEINSTLDRWGTELRFQYNGDSFDLVSPGPDRELGNDDDIRVRTKLGG